MTTKEANKLKRLVARYADACTDNSWAGSGDPADTPLLQAKEEVARLKLDAFINTLVRDKT